MHNEIQQLGAQVQYLEKTVSQAVELAATSKGDTE
jgi:hypothetical protein